MSIRDPWLVFAGDCYYPSGGFDDFVGNYDTYDIARDKQLAEVKNGNRWAQIVHRTGHIYTKKSWLVNDGFGVITERQEKRDEWAAYMKEIYDDDPATG